MHTVHTKTQHIHTSPCRPKPLHQRTQPLKAFHKVFGLGMLMYISLCGSCVHTHTHTHTHTVTVMCECRHLLNTPSLCRDHMRLVVHTAPCIPSLMGWRHPITHREKVIEEAGHTASLMYLEILNVGVQLVSLFRGMNLQSRPHILNLQLFQCFSFNWSGRRIHTSPSLTVCGTHQKVCSQTDTTSLLIKHITVHCRRHTALLKTAVLSGAPE